MARSSELDRTLSEACRLRPKLPAKDTRKLAQLSRGYDSGSGDSEETFTIRRHTLTAAAGFPLSCASRFLFEGEDVSDGGSQYNSDPRSLTLQKQL